MTQQIPAGSPADLRAQKRRENMYRQDGRLPPQPVAINKSGLPTIEAPQMSSLADSFNEVKSTGLIPEFKPIQGLDASQFGQIKGYGDDYYNNLYGQAQKRLSNTYFTGANNLQDQLKNKMNKRGLIGSGIEAGSTNDLYKSFADELSDTNSNLLNQRAQNDLELSKYNQGQALDIAKSNIDVGFKNNDAKNFLSNLGLSAAGDQSRSTNDFNKAIFQSEVDQRNKDSENTTNLIDQINSALSNNNIDPQVRDYYDTILRSYMGNQFGTSYSKYKDQNDIKPDVNIEAAKEQRYRPGQGYTIDGVSFRNSPYPGVPVRR